MKNLKRILFGGLMLLGLAGCKEYKTEYSDVKHEDALVSYKKHRNSYIAQLNEQRTYHPEEYEIVFDGKIRFVLDNKEMFKRFNSNDQADVSYREKYRLILDDTNKDGTNELIQKNFMDAEFIDAQPITNRILDRF